MHKSEALGGRATIKTITPFSLFQSDDGKGPLNCDEERSAIRLWIYIHTYACVTCARTHTLWRANRRVYSSSGSVRQAPAIRWYQEVMAQNTSLTNSNYLHQASRWAPQLAWFTLRLKGKTGVSLSASLLLRLGGWLGELAERGGGVTETKIMIYKANLDSCFLLFAISKAVEVAVCLR